MGDYEGTFIRLYMGSVEVIDETGEAQTYTIREKASKALREAKSGDRIRYTVEFNAYTVVKATLYTGSTEERLDKIEAALAAAGIEIPS